MPPIHNTTQVQNTQSIDYLLPILSQFLKIEIANDDLPKWRNREGLKKITLAVSWVVDSRGKDWGFVNVTLSSEFLGEIAL